MLVSTRDVDDPDVAPQLTCDDAALGDQTLSSRGVTAVRYDARDSSYPYARDVGVGSGHRA